jgi:hypothetical protein
MAPFLVARCAKKSGQKKTGTGFLRCPLFVTVAAAQSPSTAFAMMLR